jgi:exodeoxyribonuclease VII small subunit
MTKKALDYQALQAELEVIIQNLQHDDTDVDEAVKQYQRGLEIVTELEAYLKTAENTVTELKAKFSSEN